MAIERSLYTPPLSVEDDAVGDVLEIELEVPEVSLLDDGGAEITLVEEVDTLTSAPFDASR